MLLKASFGYDDALDAFGVHGVGGALGALLTGVFAAKALNAAGADGLLLGGYGRDAHADLGVVAAAAFAVVVTLRHPQDHRQDHRPARHPDDEREGLDTAQHGERATSGIDGRGRSALRSRRRRARQSPRDELATLAR